MRLDWQRRIVPALTPETPGVRFRFGEVVSVEADRTCTVTIAGSGSSVPGVPYLAGVVPLPGAGCVLASDGTDLFVTGVLAGADRTLAPRAHRGSDQTITTATDTAVSWSGANLDAWVCWEAGNATRLTAPLTGRYTASGWAKFAANATGVRAVWVQKNGTAEFGRVQVSASSAQPTQLTVNAPVFDLTKGDYIELYVRQTSGGNLALTRDSDAVPSLSLIYLGP